MRMVAAELGFADQSHFTRAFKKRLDVTPGVCAVTAGRPRVNPRRLSWMSGEGDLEPPTVSVYALGVLFTVEGREPS